MTDANFYVQDFANANTSGNADQVYMRMAFTPFEQASSNPATQQYIDLVKAEGGQPALLGAQATSAFLLWATAAKEFLVQLGVDGNKLRTISYGKERPQCTDGNEACWQKNRRAHFAPGQ